MSYIKMHRKSKIPRASPYASSAPKRLLAACRQAVAKDAFKAVLVDHCRYRFVAFFVQRAHHASGAIYLDIGVRPQHGSRKHDAEADNSAHIQSAFGMK